MKTPLLLPLLVLLLTACGEEPPPTPDMGPVGEGLKVIGFSLIGVSVVVTLGRLLR